MNLEEAKALLKTCKKLELKDHAFGDAEVTWVKDGEETADGYFGSGSAAVHVYPYLNENIFVREEAQQLRKCFSEEIITRNDETGPDEYQEGTIMPGLTREGVLEEITRRPDDNPS